MALDSVPRYDPRRFLSNREAQALVAEGEQTATDLILTTLTSNGAAVISGYAMAKFKDRARIMGVPLDGVVGFVGFGLAALGLFGEKGSEYVMAGSLGVMNSASSRVGAELCATHEKKALELKLATPAKQPEMKQAQAAQPQVAQPQTAVDAPVTADELAFLRELRAKLIADQKQAA